MTKSSRRSFLKTSLTGLAAAPLALAATPGRATTTHIVTIKSFAFSPAGLTITAGDSVTFKNEDGAPHTATAEDGSFDTGTIGPGGAKTVTVDAVGEHDYFCRFHRSMKGNLAVG